MTDTATAPLQATLDAIQSRVGALEILAPIDPATRKLSAIGCKPNDPSFDNAALIQPVLDAAYNLDVDGLYHTSPLKTPAGKSCIIDGHGSGYRHGGKGVTGFAPFSPDQTHVLELQGDASPGQSMVVRDLYIQGHEKCDGIRVYGARNASIENVVVRGCGGIGITIEPKVGVYAVSLRSCSLLSNKIGLAVNNGVSVCCLRVDATELIGGTYAVSINGWRRGAVFTGVVCEGQSDKKFMAIDSRATLIGCYIEGDSGRAGVWLKNSRLVVIDSNLGGTQTDLNSVITPVGDNLIAGTLAWGN